LYGNISSLFAAASPIQVNGRLLTGMKLLEQAYANFGLPSLLQSSDALQGLLYGSGSILDGSAVQADFLGFSNAPISLTDNKIADEMALLNARSSALATAVASALNSVQQNGVPDSLADVDATLQDLQAYVTLKNASALFGCSYGVSAGPLAVGLGGGSLTLTITTAAGCGVLASSGASWVTVATSEIAPGEFRVSLQIVPDTDKSARVGFVIVGDQVVEVFQGTKAAFTDDPLVVGLSTIRAVHFNELRTRIDALRARYALAPYHYSRSTITVGSSIVMATDIMELRAALLDVYNAAGLTPPSYTTVPSVGAPILAADIIDLRAAVIAIE
jgi:hypothetical protein